MQIVKEESIVTADSISYAEYREKHADKNSNLNVTTQVKVDRPQFDNTLLSMESVETPLGIGKGRVVRVNKKVVATTSKTDVKERELNYSVGFELEVEQPVERERTYNRGGDRGGRGGRGGNRGGNRGGYNTNTNQTSHKNDVFI
jgi:hypothetical protein